MSRTLTIVYLVVCLTTLSAMASGQQKEAPKEIKNFIGMTLARIPSGTFIMGSPADEKHRQADEAQHEVAITKPFYLGVFEVTQGQYTKIMGNNPSHFSASGGGKQQVQERDTSGYPVERVSWVDAVEFCKKLSAKEDKTYRLPTEAEWEYACRAGTKSVFHAGNDFHSYLANINGLSYSSYGKETSGPFYRCTVKVGEYKRNDFGLYDMHGNVQEWCADWYADDYYKKSPKNDPAGPAEGTERVLRGGGWPSSAKACRSAARNHLAPTEKTYTIGFRVVLEAK
jgi:formylglycine-generating enzyme required for sulfatase activity